jgi:CRP/FNR family transcriptional regulator, cyclic AMP receptor protein
MTGSITRTLQDIPLFNGLSAESLNELARTASVRRYRKRETLCHPNDSFNGLFYLLEGLVRLSLPDPSGKEVSLMLLSAGQWFGELSLLDGQYQPAAIIAVEPSRVLLIPRKAFVSLLNSHPAVSLEMLTAAYRRLYHVLSHIKRIQFGNSYQRVARVLLSLADDYGTAHSDGTRLRFRLTHQALADLTSLSRETATQTLSAFRSAGCVRVDAKHHWILTDRRKLLHEAE